MNINNRISDVCELNKIKQSDLVSEGFGSKQTISFIFNNKQKPNPIFLELFLKKFINVNARWLITGEGEMFWKPEKDISNEIVNDPVSEYNNGCKTCRDKQVVIDLLQKQAKEKDEKIYQLQKMVGSLEQLLRGGDDLDRNADIAPTG